MYDSLILSHLQFAMTCWGFECNRLSKLQKRALRIMTNSKYNAHTEPLFKHFKLLKLDGIFYIQCMKFFYKFTNNTLPKYFHSLLRYIYEIETRNHNQLHLFPTHTHSAEHVLRHHIRKLINKFPRYITDRICTHSIQAFSSHLKSHIIDSYSMAMEMGNTELMVKLQVFTYIHDQRVVHKTVHTSHTIVRLIRLNI